MKKTTNEVPVRGPATARPDRITQEELRRYRRLRDEQRRLEEEAGACRRGLIDRLAAEVPVEPGPYLASVRTFFQPRLTIGKLQEILGEAEIEDLRRRVAPTPRVDLHVTWNG